MSDLKNSFEDAILVLEKKLNAFPIENRDLYCQWLNQQFFLVRNSTRYLALSASRVDYESRKDFRDWIHHITEETDHDVLILNDLAKMDYQIQNKLDPFIRAIVATQYHDIETNGPNALLGYALMLEGLSCRVCEKLAIRAETAHGKGSASYLRLHAKVDLEHYPEGLKKIASLNETQKAVVLQNLETMFHLYVAELDFLLLGKKKQLVFNTNQLSEEQSHIDGNA